MGVGLVMLVVQLKNGSALHILSLMSSSKDSHLPLRPASRPVKLRDKYLRASGDSAGMISLDYSFLRSLSGLQWLAEKFSPVG